MPPSEIAKSKPGTSSTESSAGSSPSSRAETLRSLRKAFHTYATSLIVASRTACENAAAASGGASKAASGGADDIKPVKEAVEFMLQQRQLVRQSATMLEGKLRGNVKESEALLCCLKSQPCVGVGGRKRKFTALNNVDDDHQGS